VYECIEKLQATGGFVEVLGGPESGRTTLVKTAVGTMGSCPLIISGAPQEYAGLPRALNMPLLEPEVLMPAIREVLYRKTVDSLVFDTIHDLDTGGSVLNLLMKYFHTLMLPVYQAKAIVYIINNDSYVPVRNTKVITSAGGKYLKSLCSLRILCLHPSISPIVM